MALPAVHLILALALVVSLSIAADRVLNPVLLFSPPRDQLKARDGSCGMVFVFAIVPH